MQNVDLEAKIDVGNADFGRVSPDTYTVLLSQRFATIQILHESVHMTIFVSRYDVYHDIVCMRVSNKTKINSILKCHVKIM